MMVPIICHVYSDPQGDDRITHTNDVRAVDKKKQLGVLYYLWLEGETVNPSQPNQYNGMRSVFFILVAHTSIVFTVFPLSKTFFVPTGQLGGRCVYFFPHGIHLDFLQTYNRQFHIMNFCQQWHLQNLSLWTIRFPTCLAEVAMNGMIPLQTNTFPKLPGFVASSQQQSSPQSVETRAIHGERLLRNRLDVPLESMTCHFFKTW